MKHEAYAPTVGERWPHVSCGEAGPYCDDDCHSHDHVVFIDGSVSCLEALEAIRDGDDWDVPSIGEALAYAA
jgi:hypothetical protein